MKETKQAKENVDAMKVLNKGSEKLRAISVSFAVQHKQTCQRDVPKLKKIKESIVYVENELAHYLIDELIEDLKQAIKTYEDAGI